MAGRILLNEWTVLAIHYGTAQRPVSDLILETNDIHDRPSQIDYFVWLIRLEDRLILVDTGFEAGEGAARGRTLLIHPVAALSSLGIKSSEITDVVVTHLHYDHAGNLPAFPNATFHIQDREMAYGTGRCMCHERMRRPFATEGVVDAVRLVFQSRVRFHDGDGEIVPGCRVHLVGGHSKGLQVVTVATGGALLVIASDALHFQHYLENDGAFPLFADYLEVIEGYNKLRVLAGANGLIIPGHDPEVLQKFSPLAPDLQFARVLL
ncbi:MULTISPECIES: N-acyl homoserine lactonase family protein [Rhizobium]|jgi:glyoxylase-like metal-dependent hydrolase (beta-lactamase superfamily II)|uniref:Metallo-beta-lactamase family hydrolase protein n=7 Tax=Rhizobium TaxID=379 RepID=A0A192TL97_9HYPH|nr:MULTISPECIES: N-acyl homoserine lactonase family protein [Rhizobium]AJC82262.1 metallo-beta-lactamase family hydrolase protein [Rhizobium etli bv. phaseoli str. IE4803]ANK94165.1 metallo-beta-lactamase family hydrolase protein [Rhizobium sp. N6212]ANL00216.1 metallo-beta-lactamase family hydrolase protein [Rhizobium sp. N621]ANL12509.1 metallo-beta-lactamase family hydrolase protein [Rhizobium sp. N1341]ANL24474.1 metallo-beta-lactamase family hydrolase protein [Rhizobium sp. N113]ANM37183